MFRPGRIVKGTVKTVANVPAWFALPFVRETTTGLINFIKPIYQKKVAARQESFEAAMQRLHLTEADLTDRASNLQKQSWLFGVLAVAALLYALYWIFHGLIGAFLITLGVSALFLIKWAHCRFWIFQIRQRKLGCSWREWWQGRVQEQTE